MSDLLEGIRRDDWTDEVVSADVSAGLARRGEVAYRIVAKEKKVGQASGDKRSTARRRTRLQSGKLLDSENRFVSECLFLDCSGSGWRLKLARNVGAPAACRIYDDETGEIAMGAVIWRKDAIVGVRKLRTLNAADVRPAIKAMLAGKYYAVKS